MSISTYSDFQALESSEKIVLVSLDASKRLVGWATHATYTNVYYLSLDVDRVSGVEQDGTALTEKSSLSALDAATGYLFDRDAKILYLNPSGANHPNADFIAVTARFFFSNVGIGLPHNLSTGYSVFWAPYVLETSNFGVELDQQNQSGLALEGSGSVKLINDQSFWKPNFDKWYWENRDVYVYSYNRELPVTEAKLIYRGKVIGKTYAPDSVSFRLRDLISELRAPVSVPNLEDVSGALIPEALKKAKQRLVYGRLKGHRPTSLRQLVDGKYKLAGTVSINNGSATLSGSGTNFLDELWAEDEIYVGDSTTAYTVAKAAMTATSATLNENWAGDNQSNVSCYVRPKKNTHNGMNRVLSLAGHAVSNWSSNITAVHTLSLLSVADTTGFKASDPVVIGSESTTISRVTGNYLKLSSSLSALPSVGNPVVRPPVSDVKVGNRTLVYSRDYTYTAASGTLTIDTDAEANVTAPLPLVVATSITFTNGSKTVSGVGTKFTEEIEPLDWICPGTDNVYVQVHYVISDTSLELKRDYGRTSTTTNSAKYKRPEYIGSSDSVVSCSIIGKTKDGTTTGEPIETAADAVKDLLTVAGLSSLIEATSFTTAANLASHIIGVAIPEKFSDTKVPAYRDVINKINRSVFGALVQNEDFQLEYLIFSPEKPSTLTTLKEYDILNISIDSRSDQIAKTAKINYEIKEYDASSGDSAFLQVSQTSDSAQYLAKVEKEFELDTILYSESDAQAMANRFSFLLEMASSVIKIETKLQISRLQVGDKIEVQHEKLYERIGSGFSRKIAAINSAKKSAFGAELEIEDLSNAFSRVACITTDSALDWSSAGTDEKSVNGYITNQYGYNESDASDFGINLIW